MVRAKVDGWTDIRTYERTDGKLNSYIAPCRCDKNKGVYIKNLLGSKLIYFLSLILP